MTERHGSERPASSPGGGEPDIALLRPLAFAEGQGLPAELWAALVRALSEVPCTAADVLTLAGRAAGRVAGTTTPAGVVHRIPDEREALRLRRGGSEPEAHRAITAALLAAVPRDAGTGRRDWAAADPYILEHLATHAAAAGGLDEVLEDADYLVHAAPHGLLRALTSPGSDKQRVRRDVYRASAHVHAALSSTQRRDILAVDAARFHQPDLAGELSRGRPWRPRWATGSMAQPALRLARPGPGIAAAACVVIDGRPYAVTGCYDGRLRVWDLESGDERLSLREHPGVHALDCVDIDGRPHAVTGSSEGTVRVWDLTSGSERAAFTGHRGWVRAVACTMMAGRPYAVSVGEDRVVRLWDLTDGSERARMSGHTREILAVACTVIAGRPVAVTGGYDKAVRVWDLKDGGEHAVLTGHTATVHGAACAVIDGLPHAITVGGDRTVRVWRLTDGSERAALTGHPAWISDVACVTVEGRAHAVTGSGDATVRLWDLTDGSQRAVLTGHRGESHTVACADVDGRAYVVSGGRGAPPRVWDPADTTRPDVLEDDIAEVRAVRCVTVDGRPHALTTAGPNLRLWDVATGDTRIDIAHAHGHGDGADELACTMLDGQLHAVLAGCCTTVQVVDLADGTSRQSLPGHEYQSCSVACLDLGGHPYAVTTDENRSTRVWNLEANSGQPVDTSRSRSGTRCMEPVTIDGHPHLVTGGDDGGLRVWRFTASGRRRTTLTIEIGRYPIRAMALTSIDGRPHAVTIDGNPLAGTIDGHGRTTQVWDLTDGTERAVLTGHYLRAAAVACTDIDGRPHAVTVDIRHTLYVWDLLDGRLREQVALPTAAQTVACAGPDIVLGMGSDVVALTRDGR